MIDLSQYVDLPILCAVYLLAEIGKKTILKDDKARGLIPIIGPVIGAVLSICVFLFIPQFSTSVNITAAFANGVISGAAATGANQIYKQLYKFFNPNASDTTT